MEHPEDFRREADVVQPREAPGGGEEADDGLLPVDLREGAQAHLQVAGLAPDPPFLREVLR